MVPISREVIFPDNSSTQRADARHFSPHLASASQEMKFKLIKSMAHNWTHSFMSGMNWVDGDYVFEDMHKLARERRGQKVVITWLGKEHVQFVWA